MQKYKFFFDDISDLKLKQLEQKKRGLNDFNLLSVVRGKYEEVGLHSQFIFALLDESALHYQDELFLNLFIKFVLGFDLKAFGHVINIQREDITTNLVDKNKRRIDFTIESENFLVGIEMKLYAEDQKNQIIDYKAELDKRNETYENSKIVEIYYLTLDGKKATKESHGDVNYKRISFKKEILNWMNACINEVENITNLYILLSQYRDIVLQITKQYKGKVMSLMEYIKSNDPDSRKQNIKILEEIGSEYKNEKLKFIAEYFSSKLPEQLREQSKNRWNIEFNVSGDINTKYKAHIKFYKNDNWKIVYWLRFDEHDMQKMYWAIAKVNDQIDLSKIREVKEKQIDNFRNKIKVKYGVRQTSTSLFWAYSKFDINSNFNKIIEEDSDILAIEIYNEFLNIMNILEDNELSLEVLNSQF